MVCSFQTFGFQDKIIQKFTCEMFITTGAYKVLQIYIIHFSVVQKVAVQQVFENSTLKALTDKDKIIVNLLMKIAHGVLSH